MGINKILPFAQGVGANVLSDVDYAALTALLTNGFLSGTALSVQLNKVWRQSSSMAVGLAEFVAANQVQNVSDDLSAATMAGLIEDAIVAFSAGNFAALAGSASQAFSAATPAQFDNDTSVATTEFVQRAIGSYRSTRVVSGATTLDASDIGKVIICGGSGGYDVTLPAVAGLPDGAGIILWCNSTNPVNAKTPGADVVYYGQGSSSLTTFQVAQGAQLGLIRYTAAGWVAEGSAQLKYSTEFGALLAASGYQKLPSGLIVQWGAITTSAAADVSWTYPIAFPTALYNLSGASLPGAASPTNARFISFGNPSGLSSVPVSQFTSNTAARVADVAWLFAIGR